MDEIKNPSVPAVTIMPTIPENIGELKCNLRAEDAAEILRFGVTIQHALWRSYRGSLISRTAFIDNKIAACWGCCGTFMGNTGICWLMTTPEVHKVSPLKFTRIYQREVIKMLKIFPRLENWVDQEYASAIRLLEIIGFTVEKPEKMGNGFYRKFWIER